MNEVFTNINAELTRLKAKWLTLKQVEDDDIENVDVFEIRAEESFLAVEKIIAEISTNLKDKKVSPNFEVLLQSLIPEMTRIGEATRIPKFVKDLDLLISDVERVSFMTSIAVVNNTAIIVGANGSGKSTFINSIGTMSLPNVTVIPAQKTLYFSSGTETRIFYTVDDYQKKNLTASNEDYKTDTPTEYGAIDKVFRPFTLMITALVNQLIEFRMDQHEDRRASCAWDKMMSIWEKLIPEVKFKIDTTYRTVIAVRNEQEYSINRLSDGEKCILFYLGNVFIAKKSAYIVVDEPETFLNAAVYNKLWDMLIEERDDCQFVFASHNIKFITARREATIVWCKQFTPPDRVELRPLESDLNLPVALLTELVGSRRKILFCEGTEASYDYQIFSALFMDDYTVKPVGGHDKVIEYTRVFNELPQWIDNSAIGIIDRDGISNSYVDTLKEQNIRCLPWNEIEMLLVDKKVVQTVVQLTGKNQQSTINNFKKKLFEKVAKNKSKIILNISKNLIDSEIRNQFIDSKRLSDTDDLLSVVNALPNQINATQIIKRCTKDLEEKLSNDDYDGILTMCTLKGEVTRGLANKFIQADYVSLAIGQIALNEDLKKYLIDKVQSS